MGLFASLVIAILVSTASKASGDHDLPETAAIVGNAFMNAVESFSNGTGTNSSVIPDLWPITEGGETLLNDTSFGHSEESTTSTVAADGTIGPVIGADSAGSTQPSHTDQQQQQTSIHDGEKSTPTPEGPIPTTTTTAPSLGLSPSNGSTNTKAASEPRGVTPTGQPATKESVRSDAQQKADSLTPVKFAFTMLPVCFVLAVL